MIQVLAGPLGLALTGPAAAHDFATIVLGPTPDWCDALHAQAAPADVVLLLPGSYPGGCELSVGGFPEHNEGLYVAPFDGDVVIEPDADGVSLRITGEPTRIFGLTLGGRVLVGGENVTIDTCTTPAIDVEPGIERVTVLFSTLGEPLVLGVVQTVVRGNSLPGLDVVGTTGLVADNAIDGDAWSTLPFHRNLVVGDLHATADAFANVITGSAHASGRFSGNTALGPVSAVDARNNLTAVAELPPEAGNLRCPECLAHAPTLDVRPVGLALESPLVDSPDDTQDFCGDPHTTVGAVGPLDALEGAPWSAWDRVREGCVEGLPAVPPPPPDPEPFVEDSPVEPRRACATGPSGVPGWAMLLGGLLWRRRCPR